MTRHNKKHDSDMQQQRYTSLMCSGSVDLTIEACDDGLTLRAPESFECTTNDTGITVRSRSTVSFCNGGDVSIVNCSNNYNSSQNYFGKLSCRCQGPQRIVVDGVDVTDDVKLAVAKKKATIDPVEEDDTYKREYILIGDVRLNEITLSGSGQLRVSDASLLDLDEVAFRASGSTVVELPQCGVHTLFITTSGAAVASGPVSAQRLVVGASGASRVTGFHAQRSAKLNASGCGSITVGVDSQANVDKSRSGCAHITATR